MEWDFESRHGRMAQTYHCLLHLPLDNLEGTLGARLNLGNLSFIQADRPGPNFTY